MTVVQNDATLLTRHYLGDCYEVDEKVGETDQRLYLGGGYYDAPMVYVKEGNNGWTLYNIGRDYLGSVTHVATSAGVLVAEYSYDPWGRLRDPETLEIYEYGDEPDLFLGRGFTGHEHLSWCGLINMNARLYDPTYGRFLSPDPYVQAPDFTQNFNRYSYALNNPLKYSDESGEVVISALLISIGIGAIINIAFNWNYIDSLGEGALVALSGAAAGALAVFTGGSSLGAQVAIGLGTGALNSVTSNYVKQCGASGNGLFDWKELGRAAMSGAFTGAITAGANNLINTGRISHFLDKMDIDKKLMRNVVGNTIEGMQTGIIAGAANGIGEQFVSKGFQNWDWSKIGLSAISGIAIGGSLGAINGVITEGIYQKQLDKGYGNFYNSDVAEALGERAGDVAANLEASGLGNLWSLGHNYANQTMELAGSICIGLQTGRCTITINPYAPMIPIKPTYYVAKP